MKESTADLVQTSPCMLPDRVDEVLPPRAAEMDFLGRCLLDLLKSWGYSLVTPSLIESINALSVGVGKDLDLVTFKVVDQLSGQMLGLRADFTPQVARIDALQKKDTVSRFCYLGPVLHTVPRGMQLNRMPIQAGAELYGCADFEADAEIISLMDQALSLVNTTGHYFDFGHVGIYRALVLHARLDKEQELVLFKLLHKKAKPELAAALRDWRIRKADAAMLLALPDLHGGTEILKAARRLIKLESVHRILDELERLAQFIHRYFPACTVHFDLAELRGYSYHTGLVYAAYMEGCRQAVAYGGRYDGIGAAFGHARPATGFTVELNVLHALTAPDRFSRQRAIFAPWTDDTVLWELVQKQRCQGEVVVFGFPGEVATPDPLLYDRMFTCVRGRWKVVSYSENHGQSPGERDG